jgi:V/A-type H+/Na+-transporting ATPase subunit E
MEELRTTEVLGNEILEDARKKAHKILKTSDDTLAAQNRDWERKTKRSLDSIRKTFAERTRKTNEEIQARLPLDKRRLRSETTESFLVKAMNDFLKTLNREKLLIVLERELRVRLKVCAEDLARHRSIVRYSGISLDEAKAVLEKVSRALEETDFLVSPDWEYRADSVVREFPLIFIETKTFRIIASVKSASKNLMKEKRGELAAALLGEGVLND